VILLLTPYLWQRRIQALESLSRSNTPGPLKATGVALTFRRNYRLARGKPVFNLEPEPLKAQNRRRERIYKIEAHKEIDSENGTGDAFAAA
jgi:hypothetical protein